MLTEEVVKSANATVAKEKLVTIQHVKMEVLDKMNYQVRRAQFTALLCGHELMEYLEEEKPLDTKLKVQQDQLILSW